MAQLEEQELKIFDEADGDWVAIYGYPVPDPESSEESFTGVTWKKISNSVWPKNVGKKKDKPESLQKSRDNANQSQNRYSCEICGREFTFLHNRTRHLRTLHSVAFTRDKPKRAPKRYSCEFCGQIFKSRFTITRHIFTQHGVGDAETFTCDICNKTFLRKDVIRKHMERKHFKDKPFKCEVCKKEYKRRGALKRHEKGWRHKKAVRDRRI